MSDDKTVEDLQRDLEGTQEAAVKMVVGIITGITETSEERHEVGDTLQKDAASLGDPYMEHLANMVAGFLKSE